MNGKNALWLIVAFVSLCFAGCAFFPTPVPYSYAEDESMTASITFIDGIKLLDFEGEIFPAPEKRTRWDPVVVPAERVFLIKVNVRAGASDPNVNNLLGFILAMESVRGVVNRDVYFVCPPLETGKEYTLNFVSRTIRRDSIQLREKGIGKIFQGKLLYQQII